MKAKDLAKFLNEKPDAEVLYIADGLEMTVDAAVCGRLREDTYIYNRDKELKKGTLIIVLNDLEYELGNIN